jgi:phage/plasmid primase-like uncharacterized protein
MQELARFLAEKGFHFTPILDGQFHRFDRAGTLTGWFTARSVLVGPHEVIVARFGDWKTDEKYVWRSTGHYTPDESRAIEAEIQAAENREREAKRKVWDETAKKCQAKWERFEAQGESPYFTRKSLPPGELFSCKLYSVPGDTLTCVPARDLEGKLWGIQYIGTQGGKNFARDMRVKGCFHLIGHLDPGGTLYVCEGVATGGSIHLATGRPVACVFNAGNLAAVVAAFRQSNRALRIVVCGDDDRWTTRPDGSPWNPGREAAGKSCADAVLFPRFGDLATQPTDFNDLHALEGLARVTEQLRAGDAQGGGEGAEEKEQAQNMPGGRGFGVLEPLPWTPTKTGAMRPPSDQKVADALLNYYGHNIVKQEKDLFVFVGSHWRHLDLAEAQTLHQQIQTLYSQKAKWTELVGIFKLFLSIVPKAPVNMFLPRATTANFQNGTLHAVRGKDYKYRLEFRPHARGDYLTSVIPLPYEPSMGARNTEFEEMLSRVFSEDSDREEKIRAVRQMYGACLMPLFPHLFLLWGPFGSGKSSLILPAQRLVHADNWCSVEPHEFKGFLMESMVGKTVNIVTDINLTQPIDDANLKKIEDRVPVRIDRKFLTSVKAPLPATHIFGANGIPRTLDGGSGAHGRRWTFIRLAKYRATEGKYRKDFANWVFDQCPGGILNFALAGLQDLIDLDGHFTNPESGKMKMEEWQRQEDQVGSFLHDIEQNEVDGNTRMFLGADASIRATQLYKNFASWVVESGISRCAMGRNKFYAALRERGFVFKKEDGYDHVSGIGVGVGRDASH